MRRLLVPATFAGALALRAKGILDLPPTAAEASGAWQGVLLSLADVGFEAGRTIAAVLSAAAVAVLALAFVRRDPAAAGTKVAAGVALLALCDPLGLAAGREAGPGALLQLAGALFVLGALSPPRSPAGRGCVAALAVAAAALAWPAHPDLVGALPADAAVSAWAGFAGAGPGVLLLLLHHLGYATVPLAMGGLGRPRAVRLAVLAGAGVAVALVVDGGRPLRVVSFAGVAPPLLALAGLALERLASTASASWPGVLGVCAAVVAVNAPVLVSDLRSAQRFPWPIALKRLPAGDGPLHTTVPLPLRRDTDREVLALPEDDAELDALLDGGATILLPVEGGRAWGARGDDLLDRLERRRLPAFEVRVRRFDLYRYEVRAFIFPGRP